MLQAGLLAEEVGATEIKLCSGTDSVNCSALVYEDAVRVLHGIGEHIVRAGHLPLLISL